MYRIGLKSSNNFIYQIYKIEKFDNSKLYSTVKCKTLQNYANNGNRLSNRLIVRYSSQNTQSHKSGKSRIGVLAISSVTLGTFAILAYAKSNTDFRNFLEKWIPGTDKTIKLIFFEENSFIANIQDFFNSLKQSLTFGIFNTANETENTKVNDEKKASKAIIEAPIESKQRTETLVKTDSKPKKTKTDGLEVGNDNSRSSSKTTNELKTTSLEDFKKSCSQLAAKAISDYENAIQVIHNYNKNVVEIIDANVSTVRSSSIWERLREETEKKRKITQQVDKSAADVIQEIKSFLSLVNSKFDVPEGLKSDARKFADNILSEIDKTKKKFEKEQSTVKIADKYWDKIKTARENFHEELQILFPDININDRLFPDNDNAFDLFVLYMYNKVNHLESELSKLETIGNEKLKAALRSTGEGASESKINEVVSREIEKEKRILQEEFAKKLLEERKVFMEELRKQLKLQAQVNADQMKETLELKEKETERLVNHTLEEQLENESSNYKAQLGVIVGRLRGLDEALKLRLSEEKGACEVQVLWAACQSLARAVKATDSILVEQPLRPLELEIKAVLKVAPKEDTLVQATLAAIPEEAVKRGVFSENALRERFLKVEHMARRLALVPEEGASLPIYLLSYLQNFLLVKAETPITKKELSDEPIDVNKLDTYDILNRARYWLDRGNFKMSLKYMNLLSGAPRSVAKDWMNETRILLETQQAVDTLIAYTGAIGLLFLGSDNQKKVEH
ncbi:MICOS complex subunit Mic60 [Microplitis demolitor]|uniref:MICOS complex subunit Mic60 n=1 Tax=Microplitis demolitor TaxID=69319 RepID=UPI0004400328|nr:MICOS complex subunit Mic60 [Microplitis demolitor]